MWYYNFRSGEDEDSTPLVDTIALRFNGRWLLYVVDFLSVVY